MTSSAPGLLPPLLLLLTTSTFLLWVSVVALSSGDKLETSKAASTSTLHQLAPKPAGGEARSEQDASDAFRQNSTNSSAAVSSSAALKPAETFHRGSVVATFDEAAGAAFADGWVEVDEAENVAQEILGASGRHHHPHHPHSHQPTFTSSFEDDHHDHHLHQQPEQQSYECVLMPKLRPTYSEAANTAEVVDDLINGGHHQVHHLYGVDIEEDEDDGGSESVHQHHHRQRHKKKATKRRAKSAATSTATAAISPSKLRDFGNFLYVDDTARPSYSSLESMEYATGFSPPPPLPRQKVKKGHRKSSSSAKKQQHQKSGSQELDYLFSSLKSSIDQLLCYQNEECYGGEIGLNSAGSDSAEKLEAFIRHVRASKKVFELLEQNRHRLMEMTAANNKNEEDSSSEENLMMNLMMAPGVSPVPEASRSPAGPLHLPHRFMALDPRNLLSGGGGGPVVPMYDDTVQRSMAVKAPPGMLRKLMPSAASRAGGHSVGKYLTASSMVPSSPVASSASNVQHQRRSLVSPGSFDSSFSSSSSSSSSLLPGVKLGRHLIGSLLSGGANLLLNRAAVDGVGGGGGGGWQPKRQWTSSSSSSSSVASSSSAPSAAYRPSSPLAASLWPKPLLVIKEYEEYNE